MKNYLLLCFFAVTIVSCGDDDNSNVEYFITFKANGVQKGIASKTGVYSFCEFCACGSVYNYPSDGFEASIDVCNEDGEYMTGAKIASFADTDFEFTAISFPKASFQFEEDSEYYYSANSPNQNESSLSITSVSRERGGFVDGLHYTVKGTFNCNVRKIGGSEDIQITEGSFVVRFSEDQQ